MRIKLRSKLIQARLQLIGSDADLENYDVLSPLKFSCYMIGLMNTNGDGDTDLVLKRDS